MANGSEKVLKRCLYNKIVDDILQHVFLLSLSLFEARKGTENQVQKMSWLSWPLSGDYTLFSFIAKLWWYILPLYLTLGANSCLNIFVATLVLGIVPSELWRCWLGGRKGIRPVKTEWRGVGVVICLERGADLYMDELMSLPLTVSCFSKIQTGFTFLVPAHPGSPGKRAVKRV